MKHTIQKISLLLVACIFAVSCKKDKDTPASTAVNFKVKSEQTTESNGDVNTIELTYNSDGLVSKFADKYGTYNFDWSSDKVIVSGDWIDIWLRNTSGYVVSSDSGVTICTMNADNLPTQVIDKYDTTTYVWSNGNLTSSNSSSNMSSTYTYSSELNNIDKGIKYCVTAMAEVYISSKNLPSKIVTIDNGVAHTATYSYTRDGKGRVNKMTRTYDGSPSTTTFTYFD